MSPTRLLVLLHSDNHAIMMWVAASQLLMFIEVQHLHVTEGVATEVHQGNAAWHSVGLQLQAACSSSLSQQCSRQAPTVALTGESHLL
jgi:hypothetical protein